MDTLTCHGDWYGSKGPEIWSGGGLRSRRSWRCRLFDYKHRHRQMWQTQGGSLLVGAHSLNVSPVNWLGNVEIPEDSKFPLPLLFDNYSLGSWYQHDTSKYVHSFRHITNGLLYSLLKPFKLTYNTSTASITLGTFCPIFQRFHLHDDFFKR